jgi:hypothetical protein
MRLGEVPPEMKSKGFKARDEYNTVPAENWLSGEVLAACRTIDNESFTASGWADLIAREWIKKGDPTEDFRRGRATRLEGRMMQNSDVLNKAKKLNLLV